MGRLSKALKMAMDGPIRQARRTANPTDGALRDSQGSFRTERENAAMLAEAFTRCALETVPLLLYRFSGQATKAGTPTSSGQVAELAPTRRGCTRQSGESRPTNPKQERHFHQNRRKLSPKTTTAMNRHLITLLLLPVLAHAAPVDLSPPSNTLGSADRRGHLQFTVALQSADFGDGAKIPVHFTFNSGNQATSRYGWDNWTVGILEASVTDTKPGEKQVTLLCSKKLYFLEQQDGTWKSRDGAWTGEISGNDFTISRWDGWELKFTHGQVARLTTDGGKVIAWDRDGTPERRVTGIRDVASGQSVLEPIYDGNGHPTSLRINGDSYPLTREVGYPRLTEENTRDRSIVVLRFGRGKSAPQHPSG